MADCDIEASGLPALTGCPSAGEYFLVGGASGGTSPGGYGRRFWPDMVNCIFAMITTINGSQLDSFNRYYNSAWNGVNLIVYYQGQGILTYDPANPVYPNSQYIPLAGGGIQIIIPTTFTSQDIFLVTPNGVS